MLATATFDLGHVFWAQLAGKAEAAPGKRQGGIGAVAEKGLRRSSAGFSASSARLLARRHKNATDRRPPAGGGGWPTTMRFE